MNDLFLIINEAGAIECASPSAVEAFGYPLTDLVGLPWSQLLIVPEQPSEENTGPFWLRASKEPLLHGVYKTGRRFPVRLAEHEIHGPRQAHTILFLRDPEMPESSAGIFAKHRELHELAAVQGRISVWQVDYRTGHLEFSPVLVEMLGLTGARVPTNVEEWTRHFHPDDWRGLENQAELMLAGQREEINIECRVFHADGRTLWLLVRGKASFDDEKRPIKTIGTGIDITDRKRAEAERDLFFTLSLDLLCIADLSGYFRRVNPAFCKTLGYTEEELTAQPFFSFVHPDDVASTTEVMVEMTRGVDTLAFENRYRCKDGSWRWLAWTCPAPAPGSDRLYAVARDVTEAKRAQAELQQALQSADKANRAKSEFLSRMSHELRTPLNAILGFGQLLQRQAISDQQRQQVDLIVNGGRHLLQLINEVLDITRIEAGRMDISPETIDVADLLHEAVSLTQPLAAAAGIHVTIDADSVVAMGVHADRQRLTQVLLNLLSNAIKYNIPQGSVRISGEQAGADRFRIHVRDAGVGIALEQQHRLFTPFDRLGADATTIEGSGLGLTLSRHLIEIMGGTLTFASEKGRGSTFTVELALRSLPIAPTPSADTATISDATLAHPARTILCIEDNLANVRLIEAVLAYRPGVRLLTALQAGIGLELARQHRPHLILLDVHLPDMHGQVVMGKLHADPELRSIPVVVISADATRHQIAELMQAGARDYLTKPIDVENLLVLVDRYLKLEPG